MRGTSKQEQLEKRLYEEAQIFIETKKNLEGLISELKSSKQELSKVVRDESRKELYDVLAQKVQSIRTQIPRAEQRKDFSIMQLIKTVDKLNIDGGFEE